MNPVGPGEAHPIRRVRSWIFGEAHVRPTKSGDASCSWKQPSAPYVPPDLSREINPYTSCVARCRPGRHDCFSAVANAERAVPGVSRWGRPLLSKYKRRPLHAGLVRHDIALQAHLNQTHPVRLGLLQCLLLLPAVVRDAVARDHGAGAVGTAFAVHKD